MSCNIKVVPVWCIEFAQRIPTPSQKQHILDICRFRAPVHLMSIQHGLTLTIIQLWGGQSLWT